MTQHFSELSTSYNELRTTDEEPIDYVKDYLSDTECVKGLDIGCGSGRYDLLMLQKIPVLYLICADVNKAMVDETKNYLKLHAQSRFIAKQIDAEIIDFEPSSLDFVCSSSTVALQT